MFTYWPRRLELPSFALFCIWFRICLYPVFLVAFKLGRSHADCAHCSRDDLQRPYTALVQPGFMSNSKCAIPPKRSSIWVMDNDLERTVLVKQTYGKAAASQTVTPRQAGS